MQREEQRRRSRAAILEAAGSRFERYGFAATSLSDVAAELGMVRGTVHFHFATKDGLVDALSEHFDSVWDDLARDAMDNADTPLEGLIAFSHSLADALRSDARLRGALRVSRERTSAHGDADIVGRWIDLVSTTLPATARTAPPNVIAASMWGALDLQLLGVIPDTHELIDATWSVLTSK